MSGSTPASVPWPTAPFRQDDAIDDVLRHVLDQKCHPRVATTIAYWRFIRPPTGLPGRQHLDPAGLRQVLPNIQLMDVIRTPRRRYRYRLMGTRICQAIGRNPTGRYMDEVVPDFDGSPVAECYASVVDHHRPEWYRGAPWLRHVKQFLTLERIYLPLAEDGSTVDMVLGCSVFSLKDGREF